MEAEYEGNFGLVWACVDKYIRNVQNVGGISQLL